MTMPPCDRLPLGRPDRAPRSRLRWFLRPRLRLSLSGGLPPPRRNLRKSRMVFLLFICGALAAFGSLPARAAGGFELVTGKGFDTALPRDSYHEGNAIPVQKRNAAVLKT